MFSHAARGYSQALGAVCTALALHALLREFGMGRGALVSFIYIAALLIGSWRGYGPGLAGLALGLTLAPLISHSGPPTLMTGGLLAMLCVMTSTVANARRRTEALLRRTNDDLDRRVRHQTAQLERVNTALANQLAELENLYREMPVGLCVFDRDLRFLRINQKLAAANGQNVEFHLGRSLFETFPPTLASRLEPVLRRSLKHGEIITDFELESARLSPDGQQESRWWNISCSPVRPTGDQIIAVQVIVQDITERKMSEIALREANADLSQFAHIAAHDLQEPLRTIVTFSQLVQRRVGPSVDPETRSQLDFIVAAGARMSQLIADVLAYSSAGSERRFAEVSLKAVCDQVRKTLGPALTEARATVECAPLPTVRGDERQLRQVFLNLLGNSLKYRRSEETLHITISAEPADPDSGLARITIADNGRGFRPEYAERIFGIFRRLHGQEVAGSGIGLAICRRIVERHGGTICAEAAPNAGAKFHFTLPVASANAEGAEISLASAHRRL